MFVKNLCGPGKIYEKVYIAFVKKKTNVGTYFQIFATVSIYFIINCLAIFLKIHAFFLGKLNLAKSVVV